MVFCFSYDFSRTFPRSNCSRSRKVSGDRCVIPASKCCNANVTAVIDSRSSIPTGFESHGRSTSSMEALENIENFECVLYKSFSFQYFFMWIIRVYNMIQVRTLSLSLWTLVTSIDIWIVHWYQTDMLFWEGAARCGQVQDYIIYIYNIYIYTIYIYIYIIYIIYIYIIYIYNIYIYMYIIYIYI